MLDQQPEIVAVLVGINDVRRQFDSPLREQAQVPPEEYGQNLCRMAESTLPTARGPTRPVLNKPLPTRRQRAQGRPE